MRIQAIVSSAAAAAAMALALTPSVAFGALAPPSGPGSEKLNAEGRAVGLQPGWEASGGFGTGFVGTYEFGVDGRVGYTWDFGMYLGGNVQGYWGNSANGNTAHANFFGPEVGYKLYPNNALEVRPYLFAGPAFVTQVSNTATTSKTAVAIQPGGLVAYHTGHAFVGADLRLFATPTPISVGLMLTGGAGF
jgi:hypothetical protein